MKNLRKIEGSAITGLRAALDSCSCVDHVINDHDNKEIWDGFITIYGSEKMAKEDHLGRIDIQVKGTKSPIIKEGNLRHDVETADLKGFLKNGGAMYFIGVVDRNNRCEKLYYRAFLPFDLRKILANLATPNQKTKRLSFFELPTSPERVERILRAFLRDKQKQASVCLTDIMSLEELIEKGETISSLVVTRTLMPGETVWDFDSCPDGSYLYAKTASGMLYPLEHIYKSRIESQRQVATISSGDFSQDCVVEIKMGGDSQVIRFDNFIIKGGENGEFKYFDRGTIAERLRAALLMGQIAKTGEVKINGCPLCRITQSEECFQDSLKRIQKYLVCSDLIKTLHIKLDFDPSDLSEQDIYRLNILIAAFVKEEEVSLNKVEDTSIVDFPLGGGKIKVFAEKTESGKFRLHDLFGSTICLVPEIVKDGAVVSANNPIPAALLWDRDEYKVICNFDSNLLAEGLNRFPPHQDTVDYIRVKLLEMITAWDEGACCPNDLLACCEVVARSLYETDCSEDEDAINYLQSIARKRDLEPDEIDMLNDITARRSSDINFLCATAILKKDYSLARKLLNSMEDSDRERFESWPLATLVVDNRESDVSPLVEKILE